jgi:hypothetical protein
VDIAAYESESKGTPFDVLKFITGLVRRSDLVSKSAVLVVQFDICGTIAICEILFALQAILPNSDVFKTGTLMSKLAMYFNRSQIVSLTTGIDAMQEDVHSVRPEKQVAKASLANSHNLVFLGFSSRHLPLIPESNVYTGTVVNFPKYGKDDKYDKSDKFETNPAIVDWFLRRFASPKSIALIVRGGSGTAALACAYFGMHSVSLELDAKWVHIAITHFRLFQK